MPWLAIVSNCTYCKASLYPLCITAVRCRACIAPMARHREHGLLYNPSVTDTLGTSAESSMLHRVLCCSGNYGCHCCRFFGGNRHLSFDPKQLQFLLGRISTQSCLTILMMLFLLAQAKCHWGMAPRTFMAAQLLVCNLLGSPCLVIWTLSLS